MYDCVTGIQIPDNYGCIMADEMVSLPYFLSPPVRLFCKQHAAETDLETENIIKTTVILSNW